MTPADSAERGPLESRAARAILDQWTQSLAQVLESMTDCRPEVEWRAEAEQRPDAAEPLLWWEQPLRGGEEMVVWAGAPRGVWEHAGTITLKAAGVETVAEQEARNTWLEILGQSLGDLARAVGGALGREMGCENGAERAPADGAAAWASVWMRFADQELPPCAVVLSPGLAAALAAPRAPAAVEEAAALPPRTDTAPPGPSRTMELLLDVDLPVSISFGRTRIALRDVLKLMTGSIVELNRGVNDQVDVLVNQHLIARGEVVVVEGNYGVRIQEIASRGERLRSIQ